MQDSITREQAEQALAAIKEQFKAYTEPLTLDSGRVLQGCPLPTLSMDWDGRVAILWEDGPDDWAYRATSGGTSEEERVLVAEAAKEFGQDPQQAVNAMKQDQPVAFPEGVYAEPYCSFILCLYPDN